MTTKQVLEGIRQLISRHIGSERELYEELMSEAEGWNMRLEELEARADSEDDEDD